jgi:hypothetical protein
MAIHRADRVLRVKIGVDYLFLPLISSSVLRMNVLAQFIDGPNRKILRARPIAPQTVSAFLIFEAN